MTDAERALWNAIRNIPNKRFRRQHPIGDYIADFICLKHKLIIEVDGGYHSEPHQQEDDAARTLDLNRMGYRVIRFSNEEVLYNTENVIEQIKNNIVNN